MTVYLDQNILIELTKDNARLASVLSRKYLA
jgi:hypothetical protein